MSHTETQQHQVETLLGKLKHLNPVVGAAFEYHKPESAPVPDETTPEADYRDQVSALFRQWRVPVGDEQAFLALPAEDRDFHKMYRRCLTSHTYRALDCAYLVNGCPFDIRVVDPETREQLFTLHRERLITLDRQRHALGVRFGFGTFFQVDYPDVIGSLPSPRDNTLFVVTTDIRREAWRRFKRADFISPGAPVYGTTAREGRRLVGHAGFVI